MNPPGPPVSFWVFMGVWCILGVGSAVFSRFCRDAALKRAVFPWFMIGVGGLFALFVALIAGEPRALAFVVPAVVVIVLLSMRLTKFCDACGETLYNHAWFTPMRFCPKCGASLISEIQNEAADREDERR